MNNPPGYLRCPILRSTGHFFSSSLTSDPEGPTPRDKSGPPSSSDSIWLLTRKVRHLSVPVVSTRRQYPSSSSRVKFLTLEVSVFEVVPETELFIFKVVLRSSIRVPEFTSCSSKGLSVAPALDSSRFCSNQGQFHSS